MPTYVCSSEGQHPENITDEKTGKCPHWGQPGCALEPGQACEHRVIKHSEREVRAKEHVEQPEVLEQTHRMLKGLDIYELFADGILVSLKEATKIIRRLNPIGKRDESDPEAKQAWNEMWAYWTDLEAIEFDMAMLSSLFGDMNILHGKLKSQRQQMRAEIKKFRAKKAKNIRKSFGEGLRPGKASDKTVEQEVEVDEEVQELEDTLQKLFENCELLEAELTNITHHTNVLKKHRETLVLEKFGALAPSIK